VAILPGASVLAPFFQQNMLTLCLGNILVMITTSPTFSLSISSVMVICDQ
jgi:hypothetical protein